MWDNKSLAHSESNEGNQSGACEDVSWESRRWSNCKFLNAFSSGLKNNRIHDLAWELKSLSLSGAVVKHAALGVR